MKGKSTVEITVTEITVLEGKGLDKVFLYTELPFPLEFECGEPLILEFEACRGTGGAYAEKHFPGIPAQVVKR